MPPEGLELKLLGIFCILCWLCDKGNEKIMGTAIEQGTVFATTYGIKIIGAISW
jgi:hypothetical protein